jgi:hypothetical protein
MPKSYSTFIRESKAEAEAWPKFTDNPVDRLKHTLAAYKGVPDNRQVLTATGNLSLYGTHDWTGLTYGDLRAIAELL